MAIENYANLTLEQRLDAQISELGRILKGYEKLSSSDNSYTWRAEALAEQLTALLELRDISDTSAAWEECYQEDLFEFSRKSV